MSRPVEVKLGPRSYAIRIGRGLDALALPGVPPGTRALVVTDSNVDGALGETWERRLAAAGLVVTRAVVPAGEKTKNLQAAGSLCERAAASGLDRQSVIVALGGGMVGDLAGFVAAVLFRGVRFVQVPTTLLAMVDSSVGGKTAVNLPQGKNLVGAFHQPIAVIADLDALATLPDREYRSGLAEVVKCGAIYDAGFFAGLEASADALAARDLAVLDGVVARCCAIKAEVVAADERDASVRAILNFGHTLGHAIESAAGYGEWLHGEALAVGMAFAARVSASEAGLPAADASRIVRLLERLGLPVRPGDRGAGAPWAELRRSMSTDKKSSAGTPRFVLLEDIGRSVYGREVPEKVLTEAFAAVQAGILE